MKKLLTFAAVAIFAAASTFANIELDASFKFGIMPNITIFGTNAGQTSAVATATQTLNNSYGFDVNAGFFFGTPKVFNAGLDVRGSYGFSNSIKQNIKKTNITTSIGFKRLEDFNITIGPAFRINLGQRHSIFIAPGIGVYGFAGTLAGSTATNKEELTCITFSCNLNLGYRFWIIANGGFNLGIAAGVNLTVPVVGIDIDSVTWNGSTQNSGSLVVGGFDPEIYVGVCMNFGSRL